MSERSIEVLLQEIKDQGEESLAVQKNHFQIYSDFLMETKDLQKRSEKRQATHLAYVRILIVALILVVATYWLTVFLY